MISNMISNMIFLAGSLALASLDASEDAATEYPLGHLYDVMIDPTLSCSLQFDAETTQDDILTGSLICSGAQDTANNISGFVLLTLSSYAVQFDVESAVRPVFFEDIYCNAWPDMSVGETRTDVCWVNAHNYRVRRIQ